MILQKLFPFLGLAEFSFAATKMKELCKVRIYIRKIFMSRMILAIQLCFVLLATPLTAETPSSAMEEMPSMRQIYHPVSTTSKAAQESFNTGLTYVFAYNHNIAFREFEKAAKIDPNLAMAYWGMALALGQNINQDVTPENEIRCYEYIQKALKLMSGAPAVEQAYINALATRYTNDPKADLIPLRFKYREAMKKVATEYPEDLDAACLYAESILNLDPWKYWTWDGKPKEGTLEAIDVLNFVLRRNPEHIGANHFNIHAWEESPTPERALLSAYRLTTLLPESGHLLHMPCHIFALVGDYEQAIKTSKHAIAADRQYVQQYGVEGYPLHYLSHNLYVLARIYLLAEDEENAIKSALELIQFMEPHFAMMPEMGSMAIVPLEIYLYFHRWKEVLDFQLSTQNSPYVTAYWHFSRATAYANLGDMESAQKEQALMLDAKKKLSDSESIAKDPAPKVFQLAELVLNAAIAHANKRESEEMAFLTKAVDIQERLNYDEPPAWYFPIRSQLGKLHLQQNKYQEAEADFKIALKDLQRNGRLLFGLSLALKEEGKHWDAFWVSREMTNALKLSDHPLSLENL